MKLSSVAYRYIDGKFDEIILSDKNRDELISLDTNIKIVTDNIKSFVSSGLALNMLFWGEKGSGKSTLLRQIATDYAADGLVTIEFLDESIGAIYEIYKVARANSDKKLIIYFDDISFDETTVMYRRFKSAIEGGLEEKPSNIIFVVTSNKRHIVAEKTFDTADIYTRDEVNERTSLEARFGINVRFGILSKEEYLKIAEMYLKKYDVCYTDSWQTLAENYAIDRGGRSGRLAKQFAMYYSITGGEI